MEIIQEMGKSYLCVDACGMSEYEYAQRMLTDNDIKGYPICRSGIYQNRDVLKYDITNMKDLIHEYDSKSMYFEDVSRLLTGIAQRLMTGSSYLLDSELYVYDPEYIYVNMETGELNVICIPYQCMDNKEEERYHALADFLLDKIDHKDEKAVSIAYQFYRMSKERLFSLIGFCSLIEKEAGERNTLSDRVKIEERNCVLADGIETEERQSNSGEDIYGGLNELKEDESKESRSSEKRRDIIKEIGTFAILAVTGVIGLLSYFFIGRHGQYGIQLLSVSVIFLTVSAILGIKGVVGILRKKEEQEIEKDMSECRTTVGEYWGTDEETVFFDEETQFFDLNEKQSITVEWNENGEERRKTVNSDCVVIGKKAGEADLIISDPTVSRKHAKMTLRSGEIYLQDLGSTNGTYVEGRKLGPGEDIKLYNNKDFLLGKVAVRVV